MEKKNSKKSSKDKTTKAEKKEVVTTKIIKKDTIKEKVIKEPIADKKFAKTQGKEDYSNLHIIHMAAECVPFMKTGGLADVVGSLASKQFELGAKVSVFLPKYLDIAETYSKEMKFIKHFDVYMSWRKQYAGIFHYIMDGVDYYFIDNQYYFGRSGLYGYGDDGERFGFFTLAVLEAIAHLQIRANIIHAHDWHVGMAATIYHEHYKYFEYYKNIHFILTIHNPAYQGNYDKSMLGNIFGLNEDSYNSGLTRFKDGISYIKSGIVYSDFITTVSPSHRQELVEGQYSYDLDGILKSRADHFVGILNGINYKIYNPEVDPSLISHYNVLTFKEGKEKNKREIQKRFNLPLKDVPLMVFVSRLTWQKGLEILMQALQRIVREDIQILLIGNGDHNYEKALQNLRDQHPNKVAVYIGFSEKIAQLAYAAGDFLLMPSLFEPCGINQMIALRYGTIPIVRECGGLKDTVKPYNQYENTGNGFSFQNFHSNELYDCMKHALEVYKDKEKFDQLIVRAMKTILDWDTSAKEYLKLYQKTLQND